MYVVTDGYNRAVASHFGVKKKVFDPREESQHPLSLPVGVLLRPVPLLAPTDTLEQAAARIRETGCPLLPVVHGQETLGTISEVALRSALAAGADPSESIEEHLGPVGETLPPDASGAEALRRLESGERAAMLVVDAGGKPLGVLQPSDLYPKRVWSPRPPMVGGMATPFGVYLTTGGARGGASDLALMTTGMALMTLMQIANLASGGLARWLPLERLEPSWALSIQGVILMGLFMLLMRSVPLSGIHAAEHQVVHAIERGEPLTLGAVRRMPRVHPRCGTNLAVAMSLFLGISGSNWTPHEELRLMAAVLATLFLWRPLGSLVQTWVTTRPPSEKQLRMGIQAGKELLIHYGLNPNPNPPFYRRIWAMGLLQVLAGAFLMAGLFTLMGLQI